jgi:hypothetical protein
MCIYNLRQFSIITVNMSIVVARQGYHQKIPCGATPPLGSACRMVVPERGGGNEAVYCLNYLAVATSPTGRKHQHVLQITLYY